MPQLAPVNWLFLFILFWFIVILSSALIWWSSKTDYTIEGTNFTDSHSQLPDNAISAQKSWNW